MKFTPLQALVAKHYEGGEFDYLVEVDEAENCDDTLFEFVIREAGDARSVPMFCAMLETAISQLRRLQGELR